MNKIIKCPECNKLFFKRLGCVIELKNRYYEVCVPCYNKLNRETINQYFDKTLKELLK